MFTIIAIGAFIASVIITIFVSMMAYQLRKESRDFLRILTTPKPQVPLPPPQYLTYEKMVQLLTKHVTVCFQRGYINQILPSISSTEMKINRLAPNDTLYNEFLISTVMQAFEAMPNYLQKSVFFYYDVKDKDNKDDPGTNTLITNMTTQVSSLLNNMIVKVAEDIEMKGPSSGPWIDAIDKMARLTGGVKATIRENRQMKSPDGSEVTVVDM